MHAHGPLGGQSYHQAVPTVREALTAAWGRIRAIWQR
jgi:hypothetical protein